MHKIELTIDEIRDAKELFELADRNEDITITRGDDFIAGEDLTSIGLTISLAVNVITVIAPIIEQLIKQKKVSSIKIDGKKIEVTNVSRDLIEDLVKKWEEMVKDEKDEKGEKGEEDSKNSSEDAEQMIPDQTQSVEPEDEEEIEPVVLKPCMSIDVLEIMSGWMNEWNETLEICTEEWNLVAFPVLADGRVALLFESPILEYETDEEGGPHAGTLENLYRVLVFDPKSGEQAGKYRFKVYNGYATTVFFKDDRLYAAVSPEGECQYTALQMWPGSDDEHQIRIGDDINCLAATEAGDIIVSYNGGDGRFHEAEEEGGAQPLISIFPADGERKDIGCFYDEDTEEPSEDYVIDVTLDRQERIWAMLSDEETAVMYDKDGSLTVYSLPVPDVSALAVPDDCSCLYASSQDEEEEDSYWLFRIPMTADDEEDEEPEICAVQTPEGNAVFTDGSSFLKNIMAALIDGVIYVIDLNEQ